ncbi:MAG TPA: ABC transporter permease subunit [Ilumatobacteraceae bacterium]|nr:ABC transporter permease subunit [Ilumatobacteraceae bacterium]
MIVKIVLLGLVNAVVLAALPTAFAKPDYPIAIASIVALIVIDVVYLSRRRWSIPAKYLIPGTLFLLVFALYPVLYLVYISTTNFGTGNNLERDQAIERIIDNSVIATDDAIRYDLQILAAGDPSGELAFLLTDADGNLFLGTADDFRSVTADELIEQGTRQTVDGYVALNTGQANDRSAEIGAFTVEGPAGTVSNEGFGTAFAQQQTRVYDPDTNTITDTVTGVVYTEQAGYFVSPDGDQLLPGWRANVGLDNYERLFTDERTRDSFIRVFVWTIVFSLMSVLLSFALGLQLALVFNDARMKGRRFYRSLIIIPYAIPSFMTALVWRGMLNQQFGVINRWLGTNLPWLDGDWLPYFSILLVNTWLGYPYMFLVCSGALQSIPEDLTEAASVDGASGIKRFRLITLPLLLVAVAPLLVASFAFNFNNFNLIYLLTEGRPPIQGSTAGRTDILISYVYKLAFAGGRGVDYGFAAALSVVIFMIVAGISAFSFRFTKTFEDMR